MKQNGQSKQSDRKILPGILLLVLGAACLTYIVFWAAGFFIWSFDIGLRFILGCGLVMAALGILLLQGGIVRWFRRHKTLRGIFIAAIAAFLLSFVVIEGLILSKAGVNNSDIQADFVLIPGATIVEDRPSLVLKHRLDGAIPYIRANPGAVVIVSGAKGEGEAYSEAEIMKKYLVGKGIDEKRIIEEEKATDTIGNIAHAKEIIDGIPLGHKPKIMIVTNDYHMYRALLLAKNQGMEAYGITRTIYYTVAPICYCREYFSILKLFLTGMRSD